MGTLKTDKLNFKAVDEGTGIFAGIGSPEGSVTASQGSLYLRIDGTGGTDMLYQKRTGTGNTGWIAFG